jgi:hypothetical protein
LRRSFVLVAVAVSVAAISGATAVASDEGSATTQRQTLAPLPDPTLTPGASDPRVTQDDIQQTICRPGYTKGVRGLSRRIEDAVVAEYHVGSKDRGKYKIDALIPLDLGGSTSLKDLWPEPRAGRLGSRAKDHVENALHVAVCDGEVTLADAQRSIAADWPDAAPPPPPASTRPPPPTAPKPDAAPPPPPASPQPPAPTAPNPSAAPPQSPPSSAPASGP